MTSRTGSVSVRPHLLNYDVVGAAEGVGAGLEAVEKGDGIEGEKMDEKEERIGMEHPVWHWLLEWCAQMLNRFRNDAEGRTGVLCLRKGLVVTIEDGKSVW